MMGNIFKIGVISVLLYVGDVAACAQGVSPHINADHTVTFKLSQPKAQEVSLKGSFIPKSFHIKTPIGLLGKKGEIEMKKENGCWSYTVGPFPSEIYTYYFEVDGNKMLDPNNPNFIRDADNYLNYFTILGGIADNYIQQQVAHGKVEKVWYDSSIASTPKRRMSIYTPYNYEKEPQNKYPVLYLLHGSGGDENSWIELGRAVNILDNLIAQKMCVPMIVVMPNGIVDMAAAPGENPYSAAKAKSISIESMLGTIESTFISDVVSYVESNYRVKATKQGRAIAGLSLGGLHSLFISANYPDYFDYVGLFSAQTTNLLNKKNIKSTGQLVKSFESLAKIFPFLSKGKIGETVSSYKEGMDKGDVYIYNDLEEKLEKQFKTPPHLYYIAVGEDDFVKKLNDDFRQKLTDYGYPYVYNETDGGHSWENWRKYLVDFLPRIFK